MDPWLLNHRHCPLCNLDILAAYRISLPSTTNRRRHSNVNNHRPIVTLATTSASSIHEQQQQQPDTNTNLPTISATIKDGLYDVRIHGEQNPSFRSDENSS